MLWFSGLFLAPFEEAKVEPKSESDNSKYRALQPFWAESRQVPACAELH